MMIYVNKQKIEAELRDARNLEDVLLFISRNYLPSGSLPSQVKVNGRVYNESYPHASKELPIESIYLLEIDTISPQELAEVVLDKGLGQLEKICAAFEKSADLLRTTDEMEANQYFMSSLDSLQWFLKLIQEVQKTLNLDFRRISYGQSNIEERLNKLLEVLDVITKVQVERDYVILADLVEYELVPLLNEWKDMIKLIKRD